jgi:hypothetical protein
MLRRYWKESVFEFLSGPQKVNIIAHYYCLELIMCNMSVPRRLNIIEQYFILLVGHDE